MKSGMTKVSVLYPNGEGITFDMEYYSNTHIPMVQKLLGDAMKGGSIDNGLGGAVPGSPAPFSAIGNMFFDSVEEFGKAFGPKAEEIMSDLPNFTNAEPIIQISEVM
ncbi:MAG: hypothetical protein ACI9FU_002429 [Granulosicoccus sp.]|jgi:uncharacterized protein (TIGR02118 family)